MERTYTQCAQTWPLTENVKFENIESAIQILRQACDYLYGRLSQVGAAVDLKMDPAKVQQTGRDIAGQFQTMQASLEEGSRRSEMVSSRTDEISETMQTAQARLRGKQFGTGSRSVSFCPQWKHSKPMIKSGKKWRV